MEGVPDNRRSHRERNDDGDALSDDLAALDERLDKLTQQLDRLAQTGADRPGTGASGIDERPSAPVADAPARPAPQLDLITETARAATPQGDRSDRSAALPPSQPPPPAPAMQAPAPANWAEQIAARQRALDGGIPADAASQPAAAQPKSPAGPDLAELRDILRGLAPTEGAAGLTEAVQALSHKIDQIAASTLRAQDPIAFKQLEQAVVSLRGAISHVATDGALAQLAAEVHALAAQFERAAPDNNAEVLARLEAQIASLVESDRAMPSRLEDSMRALSERLDQVQLSQSDRLALGALEDRIAKLSEKLDASDARLQHFGAIEVGLADLLVYLEEMRDGGPRGPRTAAPAAPEQPASVPAAEPPAAAPFDMASELPQPETAAEAAYSPVPPAASWTPPPVAMTPPAGPATTASRPPAEIAPPPPATQPQPALRTRERAPIDPSLPPDTPLEPGSGITRAKPGSPAARIATSEAALGKVRPKAAEPGSKAAAIAAARLAIKAAYPDPPVKTPGSFRTSVGSWFKRRSKKATKDPVLPPPAATPNPASDIGPDMPASGGKRMLPRLKKLLVAASVAIIAIGSAQTALELLLPDHAVTSTVDLPNNPPRPPADVPDSSPPPSTGSRSELAPPQDGSLPSTPAADPISTGTTTERPATSFDPAIVIPPPTMAPPASMEAPAGAEPPAPPEPPRAEVTGSLEQPPLPRPTPVHAAPPATQPAAKASPDATGPVLATALANNDPAAEYEMGVRYAEGRGVGLDLQESARWFARAADAGFAPAQFRLASLSEKGEGLKKDVPAALKLYLAAAGQGHAKAMHNLAVLYAEGIDGKPDYKAAAQWFRKAAGYGVADSQYNLAILYARGIGVQSNLAESYKWFALAAAQGDRDAAQKRDDVASQLDRQTLMAAKLAVQTFVPDREPEAATSLRVPPGGWDRATETTVKPRAQHPRRQRG